MEETAQIGSGNSTCDSTPPPPQLNGNSDAAFPAPNSSVEASGDLENGPKSDGILGKKSNCRRIELLRSSENQLRRCSPRLVENAGGESAGTQVEFPPLDGSLENGRSFKKHKKGKRSLLFIGEPIHDDEARRRWPWRYKETDVCEFWR